MTSLTPIKPKNEFEEEYEYILLHSSGKKHFVWKYFNKMKDKDYVICTVCQELQYHGGLTENQAIYCMKRHLGIRHPYRKEKVVKFENIYK